MWELKFSDQESNPCSLQWTTSKSLNRWFLIKGLFPVILEYSEKFGILKIEMM